MKDAITKQPLRVAAAETERPYLWVPVSQLDEVRKLLDAGKVQYWADDIAISLEDEPEALVVHFGRGADAKAIQILLDSVP